MPRFLRAATQNWQLKLLAVALAVLLWVVVSAEQVTSNWISIPVEVQESDPSYRVIEESAPREVRVRFAGPGREFIDLAVRRPSLVLRVGGIEATEQVFELGPSMVRLPDGLDVNAYDVDPAFVRLRFRHIATRELPVRIVMGEGYGESWTLTAPLRVTPARVRVSGPADRVAALTAVTTVPIAVADPDGAFERDVPLDLAAQEGVEPLVRTVRVSGRAERIVTARLTGIPVSLGAGLAVRPQQVDVLLRGPRGAVAGVQRDSLRVVVALDSIPEQMPPGGLPVGLRVAGLDPRLRATLLPGSAHLLTVRMLLDTVPNPGSAPGGGAQGEPEAAAGQESQDGIAP